jgi:hypothetical protein
VSVRGLHAVLALVCASGCGRSPLLVADGEGGWGGWSDDGDDGPHDVRVQMCREVDFLFVIDDSQTMGIYQQNLVENYGVFIDGIEEAISNIESTHVGVITTERYQYNPWQCGGLGGLIVATGGPGSSDKQCGPYRAGDNYMTERDNLDVAFPCAARVGTGGADHDAPLAAIVAAVSSPLVDEGSCNHGFHREGALLVLVIISDTAPSSGGPFDIDPYFSSAALLEAIGDLDDIVVVLIASTEDTPCLNPLSDGLATFADNFPHSFVGGICEHDYTGIFAGAVEVVKNACPS